MFPKLPGKVILAPMAGVTDVAFRSLCKKYGAALTVTEFVSADAVLRENYKTLRMLQLEQEGYRAAQIFGCDVNKITEAARICAQQADIIDFNLGCPAPHVVNSGAGAALLQDEQKVCEIVSSVSRSIFKPFTVKMRAGLSKKTINAIQLAQRIEKAGASAITIHARTREEGFSGRADWNLIKAVKQAVTIPVIGNGDVRTPEDAQAMLQETGCDYVMIGRTAIGNPFIFSQCLEYFEKGSYTHQLPEEKIRSFFEYLDLANQYTIDFAAKKLHAQFFTKGLPHSSHLRQLLGQTKTETELRELLTQFVNVKKHTDSC